MQLFSNILAWLRESYSPFVKIKLTNRAERSYGWPVGSMYPMTNHRKELNMNRKFKALGLAFVAVLAMSAVVASAAQAKESIQLTAASYPATIHATGEGVGENFNTEAGKITCKVSHYHATLNEASSSVTVKPTYTECSAFGGLFSATVNTEECHYVFTGTEKVAAGQYRAHVNVTCPEGQSIKITAGTCKAEVKAQTGLTTVDLTNNAGNVGIQPTLLGPEGEQDGKHGPIAYTVTQDGFGCPFNGTGAKTGGEYSTTAAIEVTPTSGGPISVSGE